MSGTNYKYGLDPGSKKFECPNCKEKRFVKYIDNATGEYFPDNYGRCDRENNCGYHYSPYDDQDYTSPSDYTNPVPPKPKPVIPTILPNGKSHEVVARTESNFHAFCRENLNIPDEHLTKWLVGAISNGKTAFGLHDGEKLINIKFVLYGSDGKRRHKDNEGKDIHPHYLKAPEGKKYSRCLYGLHLLDPDKPTALVESEKTAVIAAFYFDQFNWIGLGGNHAGMLEHLVPILEIDQPIYYFPDNDKAGRKSKTRRILEDEGKERPGIHIIDMPADWPESWDIADFLIERPDDDLWQELKIELSEIGTIQPQFKSLEITFDFEPEVKRVLASIHGIRTLSIGNIMGIIAAPGTGKSSLCDAIAAGHINAEADSLGVTTDLDEGRVLLHIDGERTEEDCKAGFLRTAKRIQIGKNKHLKEGNRLRGYVFQSFIALHSLEERKQEIERLVIEHNPQAIILDDISCLSKDSNNIEDSQEIIRWLIALANEYKFGIIATIHPNPKDETFKPRGHLGSELYRKAESVFAILRAPDDKEIRMLTTDFPHSKVRNAADNVTSNFKWSDDAKMFVACEYNSGSTDANKAKKLENILREILPIGQEMDSRELKQALMEAMNASERTAYRNVKIASQRNIIIKSGEGKNILYKFNDLPF